MGFVVDGAIVLSEGAAESEGLLFIEGATAYYLPSSASDVQTVIEKIIDIVTAAGAAIGKASDGLTAIAGSMTGPTTAPPPGLPPIVAQITAKVAELETTKSELEELKGGLK